MGMVVDAHHWSIEKDELVELPRSESVSWIDRSYLQGGTISRRHAQVVELKPRSGGATVAVVNFHLQTAGTGDAGTEMRRQQIEAIAQLVERAGYGQRIVACGDTNAFSWPWKKQGRTLQYILEPLTRLGAIDPGGSGPTHFFGRQNEPKLTHRVGVILGRAGLDLPMRYDVICTSLPVLDRGHTTTPDSDHDLIWARLAPSTSA
jgi:hypothetical protein